MFGFIRIIVWICAILSHFFTSGKLLRPSTSLNIRIASFLAVILTPLFGGIGFLLLLWTGLFRGFLGFVLFNILLRPLSWIADKQTSEGIMVNAPTTDINTVILFFIAIACCYACYKTLLLQIYFKGKERDRIANNKNKKRTRVSFDF